MDEGKELRPRVLTVVLVVALLVLLILATYSFARVGRSIVVLVVSTALALALGRVAATWRVRPPGYLWRAVFWILGALCFGSLLALLGIIFLDLRHHASVIGDLVDNYLLPSFVLVLVGSGLGGLFILAFLQFRTKFPRPSASFARFVLGLSLLAILVLSLPLFMGDNLRRHPGRPSLVLAVEYDADLVLRSDGTLYGVERFEIAPHSDPEFSGIGTFLVEAVDEDWKQTKPQSQVVAERTAPFIGPERSPGGLVVTLTGPVEVEVEHLGILRRRLRFVASDPPVRIRGLDAETFRYHFDDPDSTETLLLSDASDFGPTTIEIEMPKNSFLSSYPAGALVELPNRDQVTFKEPGRWPKAEIFYLPSMRFEWVREALKEDSPVDLAVEVLGFFLWPVLIFVLGIFHRKLGEGIVQVFRRERPKQEAGF